ncbi:restriction-modification methylase [Indivirus ILV1]|uniref:Restriction-modification methylase n=1 Tax=Indivirus ILV1 TaxID=1977633 RepID=A0A1V0SEE0_9VIRU|nr:restriction-modification methylase [Indivirus ILV1]
MSLIDLLNQIKNARMLDDVLNQYKTKSEKGFVYERLWDLVIKFGFCRLFPLSNIVHLVGNSNTGNLKELTSLKKYIENGKIISGKSSGVSDITMFDKVNKKYIFISSKYYTEDKKNKKSVKSYDIADIISMASHKDHKYQNEYEIYLMVFDKNKVLKKEKLASNSSEYITKHIDEKHVLDKNDLEMCFLIFKASISKYSIDQYDEIYLSKKDSLIMRFHQEFITEKTSQLIRKGQKQFLWGCKCRSGKTYMIGGIIIKEKEIKKKLNVLIITPAPTETIPQFTDDLFIKFNDFRDFKIHDINSSKKISNIKVADNNIFVMSKQLLQEYINDTTIDAIKNTKLDIIAFDENHLTGTTNLSKSILQSYASAHTINIYLTATYNKPLREWNIPNECQMYWDLEDEQFCKNILKNNDNIQKLTEKHGSIILETVNKYKKSNYEEIFRSYQKMPDLYLMTNLFDQERYMEIKEKIMDSKYGFSFDVLFGLNSKKTTFAYENEVCSFLRYISGSEKEVDFKKGDKSIFGRINKIISEEKSRKPLTQIWFLPPNNINEISNCLNDVMTKDNILKDYEILNINSKNNELAKDIKHEINMAELKVKYNKKKGLIILAGNMLSLGITLSNCDIVMLFNNTLSSDKVMQQMYRCMSEGDNKAMGFVIDLNISRVLHTCINYGIYKKDLNLMDKLKYLVENHLINIDADMFYNKKIDSDKLVNKLLESWKTDPINNFTSLLKNLENELIEFDNETQKRIDEKFISFSKKNIEMTIKMNEESNQEMPTGKEIIEDSDDNSDNDSDDKNTEKEDIETIYHVSFTKDVLPYVIPLACILTIRDNNKDFVQMLADIKNNEELIDIFDDQSKIWWNNKGLIDLIKDTVKDFFDKNSNIYNITINFKLSLKSLIDNPKELLELINECLKPKEVEKKQFGEVFTPMDFINNQMLKDLENYYQTKYKKNIWNEKDLTWFDPAAGMGNFPIAIYYKLMNGLKGSIPNEKQRKKHIIENMLYMSELNKKNCYVIKQIFNINNEYKLNLYEGDSLKLDIKKAFKKDTFDIIIGNPPYNEEFNNAGAGAKPLYNRFIENYIDICHLLTFIVPSRWFSGGKGLDKFRSMMLNRKDLVYINHFDDACYIFGNKVDIKGGVNYFLKDNKHNGKCNYNGNEIILNKYDIFTDGKYHHIIDKLVKSTSIDTIYIGRYFGIESNDKRLTDNNKLLKCYVSQQKGFIKYVDKEHIKKEYNFWKVVTPEAAYKHKSGFGNIFVGSVNEIHTGSYISFRVKSEDEAKSLLSYLKCKLPNFMLSLRKISQHINENVCKWIPLPPLDRTWTDNDVYKYFKLTKDEIDLIKNTKIIGYKDKEEKIKSTSVKK